MKRLLVVFAAMLLVAGLFGCTNTQKGAVIGAGSGGLLGGIIGEASGNTAVGAIVGAAVGGAAGAWIGDYMDDQAEEMASVEGAEIERVEEGIKVTFDSGILFDYNSAELRAAAKSNLRELAQTLQKYEDTDLRIEGHTDSDGSEDYNMTLSNRRADAVRSYLSGLGVSGSRFTVVGYGEMQPVASNDTPDGRQQNRRVELAITANEELQQRAEQETAG